MSASLVGSEMCIRDRSPNPTLLYSAHRFVEELGGGVLDRSQLWSHSAGMSTNFVDSAGRKR
eukprot:6506489-Alexandrium_andersonii.AAC.1